MCNIHFSLVLIISLLLSSAQLEINEDKEQFFKDWAATGKEDTSNSAITNFIAGSIPVWFGLPTQGGMDVVIVRNSWCFAAPSALISAAYPHPF